jgi:Na+-transporting NADH:ubiquinone oxidoreductase subunit NqrF
MILDIIQKNKAHRNIHLIFGTREESSILYRTDFEALTRELPHFRYDIALSQQPDWRGWKGHIHQLYLEEYPIPRADIAFYLCGWSRMVDEAMENLVVKLGYDRTQIHFELYG